MKEEGISKTECASCLKHKYENTMWFMLVRMWLQTCSSSDLMTDFWYKGFTCKNTEYSRWIPCASIIFPFFSNICASLHGFFRPVLIAQFDKCLNPNANISLHRPCPSMMWVTVLIQLTCGVTGCHTCDFRFQ